jgi:2-hydroxychromene-2-carboxylate isomerase
MFYFDGEWFWGIDRIRLLEQRLSAEGFDTETGPLCVPEPTPLDTTGKNLDGILLEYFPSLRSPYTAIGHQRVLDLVNHSGVSVKVRPVLPMMMRGIPAPREKQRYIITDAGREGRATLSANRLNEHLRSSQRRTGSGPAWSSSPPI